DALRTTETSLEDRKRQATAARGAAEKAQAAAARAIQAQNDLIRSIDQRRDLNAQLAAELTAAQQKLQAALRESGTSAAHVALPVGPFRGDLDWPVDASSADIRRRFGRTAGAGGSSSNGMDVAAPDGASARAVH